MQPHGMDAAQTCKRKQENLSYGAVNNATDTQETNSKKQRLSYDRYDMNGDQMQLDPGTQMNGYTAVTTQVNNHDNQLQPSNVMSNGETTNVSERITEPMECSVEQGYHVLEVNGNSSSSGKYCPHGHLNTCTTYNVPCRYPRMYCHPGGLLEDRLSIYHGF